MRSHTSAKLIVEKRAWETRVKATHGRYVGSKAGRALPARDGLIRPYDGKQISITNQIENQTAQLKQTMQCTLATERFLLSSIFGAYRYLWNKVLSTTEERSFSLNRSD